MNKMTLEISHRTRIEQCLEGQKTDRIPYAFWRHFPVDDQDPYRLAASISHFQNLYQFDLIKVTPASSYCLKDWGIQDEYRGNWEGTREYTNIIINHPDGWSKLPMLHPKQGFLGDFLTCMQLITREFGASTPVLPTIFSPLAQAKHLVGNQSLLVHLRKYPQEVHSGLQIITENLLAFLDSMSHLEIAGIFYAIQHASFNLLSADEYREFGEHYDLQVLNFVKNRWLNLCHIHGDNIMFDQIAKYPVQILNWHDRQTTPSLCEAANQFNGILCGGLQQWNSMAVGTPADILVEAREAIASTGGKKFILGTGCVLPIITPHGNIQAIRELVQNRAVG